MLKISKDNFKDFYVGQVFPNFRELCRFMGIPDEKVLTISGKQKILFLEKIRMFINLQERPSYSYAMTVIDIYDEPIERVKTVKKKRKRAKKKKVVHEVAI